LPAPLPADLAYANHVLAKRPTLRGVEVGQLRTVALVSFATRLLSLR
jgi:hypothetical protein